MKKKIIAATMATAMCVSLAACGGSTASSSAAESTASSTAESTASSTADAASTGDEEVDLRMAWWGSQDRHDRTIKAIELYESLHPNVKIEYEYYSFDDYFTKLKTLVASDQVWDIFQLGGNFPMYMDKIYPLDDYIASGVVDVSGIGDSNLKTTQDTEGHQLGISNGLNSYGIAYDPDMFAEAGVAEPTDTWTWDDYANAANTIHEKLGIYGCSSMLTSEFIAGCSVYVAQYGDVGQYSFFNLDLTGMGFDDPQMLTPYIQMRADSIKNEVYPDAGASAEITNIENDFLVTGEAAMAWVAANQFPTMYNVCQEQGRTLKLATLPRITSDGPSGAVIQSSQMLCVSQDSQQKEEAAKFISWFENDPDCNNILQGERGIPVNATVRETLSANATEGQQIMYDFIHQLLARLQNRSIYRVQELPAPVPGRGFPEISGHHLKIRFDLCAAQADFRFAGGVPAHPAQPHGYVLPFTVLPAIPGWRQCGRCPGVETAVCPQRSVQQRAGQHGHEHHQLVRQPETGALPADFDVRLAVWLFDDYFCRWLKRNPCQLL